MDWSLQQDAAIKMAAEWLKTGEQVTRVLMAIALLLAILIYFGQIMRPPMPRITQTVLSTEQEMEAKNVCHNRGFAWGAHKNADDFVDEVDCIFPVAKAAKPKGVYQ